MPIDVDKFWAKVSVGDPEQCWDWKASRGANGYGQIFSKGKSYAAHRVAWELSNGASASGFSVCHRCDHPICCNPGHLFLGTQRDNMLDRNAKGRHASTAHGANNNAKLTIGQVRAIRQSSESHKALAATYGVCVGTIRSIRVGRLWKNLPPES